MPTNEETVEYVNLDNLGQGAARELFAACMQEVIENILDPNTSESAARSVTLKVTIKPTENGGMGFVTIDCKAGLAQPKGYATQFYFGKKNGAALASEYNPDQLKMFKSDNLAALPDNKQASGGDS